MGGFANRWSYNELTGRVDVKGVCMIDGRRDVLIDENGYLIVDLGVTKDFFVRITDSKILKSLPIHCTVRCGIELIDFDTLDDWNLIQSETTVMVPSVKNLNFEKLQRLYEFNEKLNKVSVDYGSHYERNKSFIINDSIKSVLYE